MTIESDIAGLYIQILGRQADPSGLANAVAAVNGGATEAQIARGLATSSEAQARISELYQSELGRAADGPGLANATNALADGESLAQVEQGLAASPEARAAIARLYQTEFGRSPDSGGVASFTEYLAGGGSLTGVATSLAGSPEAKARIVTLYQTVLDRVPLPAELASSTQYLAGGGSLAGLRGGLAASGEAQGAIYGAYVTAGILTPDTSATDAQIAGGQSELLSGVALTTFRAEIADGAQGRVPINYQVAPVTPETIGRTSPSYVYSLGVSDTLTAAQPERVSFDSTFFGEVNVLLGNATIIGFNPATDVLEISRRQANRLSDLTIQSSKTPAGAGTSVTTGRLNIELLNVTPASLHASNFRFA